MGDSNVATSQPSKSVRLYHIGGYRSRAASSQGGESESYQNYRDNHQHMQNLYNQYQNPFQYQNNYLQNPYPNSYAQNVYNQQPQVSNKLGSLQRVIEDESFDNKNFIIYDKKNKCYYKIEDDSEEDEETEEEDSGEEEETEEESGEGESEEEETEEEETEEEETEEEETESEEEKEQEALNKINTVAKTAIISENIKKYATDLKSPLEDDEHTSSSIIKNHPVKGIVIKIIL